MRVLFRSEYFKTREAFLTATHNTTKVIEVKECSHDVLKAVINFMYGRELPGSYSTSYVEFLLFMADFYRVEDLKDAIATHMGLKLDEDNILDIYPLAEKYTAQRLKEMCSNFILTSISITKKCLKLDAATLSKERKEGRIENGMIVRCNTTSLWWTKDGLSKSKKDDAYSPYSGARLWSETTVEAGAIGRIVNNFTREVTVRWSEVSAQLSDIPVADISHLEILAPPIRINFFKDIKDN